MNTSRAFTMIELIFVIIILGILSAVAVPKIFATREDAIVVKTKNQIASIQSAIVNIRSVNMMSGNFDFPELDGEDGGLFGNVLQIPATQIKSGETYGWSKIGSEGKYKFTLNQKSATFTYDKERGLFYCDAKDELCATFTR